MTARRIARELAVIVLSQLPKDKQKVGNIKLDELVARSVHILVDYARQSLADANAVMLRGSKQITEIEIEHPHNRNAVEEMTSVPLKTGDIKEQIANLELAMEFIAEALDIPEMALHTNKDVIDIKCQKCDHENRGYVTRTIQRGRDTSSKGKARVSKEEDKPSVGIRPHGDSPLDDGETPKSEVHDFIINLIGTYLEHKDEVDEFIKKAKAKWHIDRMVSIDRDILRLACTEAFFMPDIPVNVAISEAVELCHRFADDKAARFINGILGDLSDEAKYFRLNWPYWPVETGSAETGSAETGSAETGSVETGSVDGALSPG